MHDLPRPRSHVFMYLFQLETRFKENGVGREEPFRGVVKFASSNLLESLKYCVSSGTIQYSFQLIAFLILTGIKSLFPYFWDSL